MLTLFDHRILKQGLALGLVLVRDRTLADATINEAFACTVAALDQHGLHARAVFSQAIVDLLADQTAMRVMHWVVGDALQKARDVLGEVLDEDAQHFAQEGTPVPAAAEYFSSICELGERFERSLTVWYNTLAIPKSAKNSLLIDVALQSPAATPRMITVRYLALRFLAQRAVDVRGVIASESRLSYAQRVEILSTYARQQQLKQPAQSLSTMQLEHVLANVCANWTAYATHPRVLFWHLRQQRDATQLSAIFQQMRRWPLSPELREQLRIELALTPQRIDAFAVSTGRWRCGRCDSTRVHAIERRALDPERPEDGAEMTYTCANCGMNYHALWEHNALTSDEPVPEGWVGLDSELR